MTESIPATPGWVDTALDRIFVDLPPETKPAREAFAGCLARNKAKAAPSDLMGAEFEPCHAALRRALRTAGLGPAEIEAIGQQLEALEAEIGAES